MASGAAGALAHAYRAVTKPGDEILTFAPYFPEYNPYVNLTGAVLKVVPPDTESFQINFDAFEEMHGEKVMAVLINTPNNPSGIVYSEETILRLADILRKKEQEYGHDIFIIPTSLTGRSCFPALRRLMCHVITRIPSPVILIPSLFPFPARESAMWR